MRTAHRRARAARLRELCQCLREVEAKIGQPHYRTVKAVQKRAETQLKQSSVGKFMQPQAYEDESGHVHLRSWVNRYPLWQAMPRDGRFLLVTNDSNLSPRKMLALYRQKDGVEKRIQVSKQDLQVSPVYLHKDERIEAMLLINMLALLAYGLLERQAHQHGLQTTTRRIIAKLQNLDVVETFCWDDSRLVRLVPIDVEQAAILQVLAEVLTELRVPRSPHPLLSAAENAIFALSSRKTAARDVGPDCRGGKSAPRGEKSTSSVTTQTPGIPSPAVCRLLQTNSCLLKGPPCSLFSS
jgi:hypothetical protein